MGGVNDLSPQERAWVARVVMSFPPQTEAVKRDVVGILANLERQRRAPEPAPAQLAA